MVIAPALSAFRSTVRTFTDTVQEAVRSSCTLEKVQSLSSPFFAKLLVGTAVAFTAFAAIPHLLGIASVMGYLSYLAVSISTISLGILTIGSFEPNLAEKAAHLQLMQAGTQIVQSFAFAAARDSGFAASVKAQQPVGSAEEKLTAMGQEIALLRSQLALKESGAI